MTPQEIAQKAGRRVDEETALANPSTSLTNFILDTLNDFQDEVTNLIRPVFTSPNIVVADVNTWYNLPSDLISLWVDNVSYSMTKDGTEYTGSFEFRRKGWTPQIKFPQTGTYTVDYEAPPTKLTLIGDSLSVHLYLQSIAHLYLGYKYLEMDNNGPTELSNEVKNEYLDQIGRRLMSVSSPSGQPQKIIDVYGGV